MERLDKRLFKRNRPIIRPFKFIHDGNNEDSAFLWDMYVKGLMPDAPADMNMDEFIGFIDFVDDRTQEMYIIEDKIGDVYWPMAFVMCRSDGWLLEPHVYYSDLATARHKVRSYVAFLKHTKYRKDLGACLVRVDKETTPLANKMEGIGLLEFVGKIWGGKPSGNEYLYSIRCQRRT